LANRKFSTLPDVAVLGDLVGTQIWAFDDIVVSKTKQGTLALLRRALFAGGATYTATDPITAGLATLVGLAVTGAANTFGTNATGTDAAAASDVTFKGPIGTGVGTTRALVWQVATQAAAGTTPQTLSDALRLVEIANATSREVVAWNPNGPLMSRVPTNATTLFLEASDGGRIGNRLKVIRWGLIPIFTFGRANGTADAPTGVLSGEVVGSFEASATLDTGTSRVAIARFEFVARENITATAQGGEFRIYARDLAGTSERTLARYRSGGSGIAEWLSGQAALRFIPATSGSFAWRNAANSADTMTLNEAGTTFTMPLVTAAVFGVDPTGSQLMRVGGSARFGGAAQFDSTLSTAALLSANLGLTVTGAAFTVTGAFAHSVNRNANGATNVLALGNLDSTAVTLHNASLLWNFATTAAATINAGAITFSKIQEWTSTAATQDSVMTLRIVIDGALATGLTLSSASGVHTATFPGTLTQSGDTASLVQSTTTSTLNVGSGTGSGTSQISIRGAAGQTRQVGLRTGTLLRFSFALSTTAESGSDAGSNLSWSAFDDAGSSIDSWLNVIRAAAGAITIGSTGNRQIIIAGSGWGAGAASLRFNGLTSGAGAGAGTLTNAPSAGDPAFWLPVSIAGTVRYIPCW
jgi:hypothetical protein